MSRLRNVHSDVVVNVADDKVGRFGSDWVPADDAPPAGDTSDPPAKKPTARSK